MSSSPSMPVPSNVGGDDVVAFVFVIDGRGLGAAEAQHLCYTGGMPERRPAKGSTPPARTPPPLGLDRRDAEIPLIAVFHVRHATQNEHDGAEHDQQDADDTCRSHSPSENAGGFSMPLFPPGV